LLIVFLFMFGGSSSADNSDIILLPLGVGNHQ